MSCEVPLNAREPRKCGAAAPSAWLKTMREPRDFSFGGSLFHAAIGGSKRVDFVFFAIFSEGARCVIGFARGSAKVSHPNRSSEKIFEGLSPIQLPVKGFRVPERLVRLWEPDAKTTPDMTQKH